MKTVAVGLVLLTCAAAETRAQATEGSIRGYLREQGAVLPGVSVEATSPAIGGSYTAVTDQDGHFRLLNLPPGTYALTATLSGFSKAVREDLTMRAGLNLAVDMVMKVGRLEETMTVVASPPYSRPPTRGRPST